MNLYGMRLKLGSQFLLGVGRTKNVGIRRKFLNDRFDLHNQNRGNCSKSVAGMLHCNQCQSSSRYQEAFASLAPVITSLLQVVDRLDAS